MALAAMHYNENSTRRQAADDHGELRYLVTYPKAKRGGPAVRPNKEKATYSKQEKLYMPEMHEEKSPYSFVIQETFSDNFLLLQYITTVYTSDKKL